MGDPYDNSRGWFQWQWSHARASPTRWASIPQVSSHAIMGIPASASEESKKPDRAIANVTVDTIPKKALRSAISRSTGLTPIASPYGPASARFQVTRRCGDAATQPGFPAH